MSQAFPCFRYVCAVLASVLLCFCANVNAFQARNLDKSLGWPGTTLKGLPCRGGPQGPGPADYRDPKYEALLRNVNFHHFSSDVYNLTSAVSSTIQGDIDYTLRAFPNDTRALWALIRLQWREKSTLGYPPAECYLQRAIAFASDDGAVRLLYGVYLHHEGHLKKALVQYQAALKLEPHSSELHYDMGLLYFDLKEYDKAMHHAAIAYRLGYPLPGLRDMLKKSGHWDATLVDRK